MLRHDPQNSGNLATKLDPTLLSSIENLKPARQSIDKPARAPKVGNTPAARRSGAAGGRSPRQPDMSQVFELARQRGIPKEVITAAIARSKDFEKYGADGFRAVCLLIETGKNKGTYSDPLLKSTYKPGLEKELLKLCARDNLPGYGIWSALRCLGYADTKEVRSYLLERQKTERGPGQFMAIAQALGELGEKQGVNKVGEQIMRFERKWSGVEPHMLSAIGRMDAALALPWYVRYVAHAKARNFYVPLASIAKADPAKARTLAKTVLDERNDLSKQQRNTLTLFTK